MITALNRLLYLKYIYLLSDFLLRFNISVTGMQ